MLFGHVLLHVVHDQDEDHNLDGMEVETVYDAVLTFARHLVNL